MRKLRVGRPQISWTFSHVPQQYDPELSVENAIDEWVDGRVTVAHPQYDIVKEGRCVQLQQGGQRHPDEKGQPADQEGPHDDPEGGGRSRLPVVDSSLIVAAAAAAV